MFHIAALTHMLFQAFESKSCSTMLSADDRKAIIMEFTNLYLEAQKQEALFKIQRQADQVREMIDSRLNEQFGIHLPIADTNYISNTYRKNKKHI